MPAASRQRRVVLRILLFSMGGAFLLMFLLGLIFQIGGIFVFFLLGIGLAALTLGWYVAEEM